MCLKEFQPDALYYQCGVRECPSGYIAPVVSTWIYLGIEHRPGVSSSDNDTPGYFYAFQEYSKLDPFDREGWRSTKVFIGNHERASESMLTWEELKEAIAEMDDAV